MRGLYRRVGILQNKAWQDKGLEPIRVAINLSIRQFEQQQLEEIVACVLNDTKLDPRYLELEITESMIMRNPAGLSQSNG